MMTWLPRPSSDSAPILISRYRQTRDAELADIREWARKHDRGQMLPGIYNGTRVQRGTGSDIIARLEALPEDADHLAVEKALRRDWGGWHCQCNGCGSTFDEVVLVGEVKDYDESTARLCRGCLTVALAKISRPPLRDTTKIGPNDILGEPEFGTSNSLSGTCQRQRLWESTGLNLWRQTPAGFTFIVDAEGDRIALVPAELAPRFVELLNWAAVEEML